MKKYLLLFAFAAGCTTLGFDTPGDSAPVETSVGDSKDTADTEEPDEAESSFVLAGAAVESTDFEFDSHGETLKGELVMPSVAGPARPGVVIVHDSGPLNRDGIMRGAFGVELPVEVAVYRSLAEELASRGFVVLIYDKRTCIQGGQPWCEYPRTYLEGHTEALATVLLADFEAAVGALRADSRTTDQVHVIAHGHGADIALASTRAAATSIVLAAPNTQAPDAMVLHQIQRSLEVLQAKVAETSDASTDTMVKQVETLEARRTELETAFSAIREGKSDEAAGLPADAWRSLFGLHERAMASSLERPTLVVEAGLDLDVDEEVSTERFEKWKADGAESVRFDELTRPLVSVSQDDDPTAVSNQVTAKIAEFLIAASGQRD